MSNTIQIKRGLVANISSAGATAGELKYATDSKQLFTGDGTANILLTNTFESGSELPSSGRTDKLFYLTEDVGTNKAGMYFHNGTAWVSIAPADSEYTMEKQSTAETGYLATYKLLKDGSQVGDSINIPKDFLVKSGSVKTCTQDDDPVEGYKVGDKYIDLVINTKDSSGTDEHLYILVKDLVDNYTAGNGINITSNKVSVDLTALGGLQFDGSTEDEKTLGIDNTIVATLDDTQTLENKTIDGGTF